MVDTAGGYLGEDMERGEEEHTGGCTGGSTSIDVQEKLGGGERLNQKHSYA